MNADQLHIHYYKRMMLCDRIKREQPLHSTKFDTFVEYYNYYRNLFDPK